MKKAVKILLIVVLALVLLIAGAVAVITMVIDPNDYKGEISSLVEKNTGYKVDFNGPLSLKYWPRLALHVEDIVVAGDPAFGDEPLLSVGEASFQMAIIPLFSGRVEVDSVVLNNTKARLAKNAKGGANWEAQPPSAGSSGKSQEKAAENTAPSTEEKSGEAKDGSASSSAEPKGESKFKAEVANISITNFSARYTDAKTKEDYSLQVNSLGLENLALGSDVGFSMNIKAEDLIQKSAAAVVMHGTAMLDNKSGQVRMNLSNLKVDLSTPDLSAPMTVEGRAKLQARIPTMDGDVDMDLKGQDFSLSLKAKGSAQKADGSFSLKSSPAKLMSVAGVKLETADKNALSEFNLAFDFALADKVIQVTGLKGNLDSTSIDGGARAGLQGAKGQPADIICNAQVNLNIGEINMDGYLPPVAEGGPEGEAKGGGAEQGGAAQKPASGKGPLQGSALEKCLMDLNLKVAKVTVKKAPVENIDLVASLKRGKLEVSKLDLSTFDGKLAASASADLVRPKPPVSVKADLKGLDVAKLMSAMASSDKLSGKANFDAALSFTGLDGDDVMKTLNGNGKFNLADGMIRNFQLIPADAPQNLLQHRRADYAVEKASGSFVVTNGVLENNDLALSSKDLNISGHGQVNLGAGNMDYRAVLKLEGQKYDLPLRVHGPFASLSYGLDEEAVAKEVVNEAGKRLEEKLEKRLEEKGIVLPKAGEGESTGDPAKDAINQGLQKGVESLLKKK